MSLTVRDMLAMEVFRRAEAEVLAGRDQLDRNVRWLHISELVDIASLLKGGEVLLTAGLSLDNHPRAQSAYVRELSEVGIAGLVFELGRRFRQVPQVLIEEAHGCQLPLIALHRETRFVEITEQVHSAIINQRFALLQKAERIRAEFTKLALGGATLKRILYRLAEIVENPVVLEDVAHQVVEFAVHRSSVDDVLRVWERHSRVGHDTDREQECGVVSVEDGKPACIWIAIILRDSEWGRVHVVEVERPLDEMDQLALDRAAAALSLAFLSRRDRTRLADYASGALLSDIVEGRYSSVEEIFRRAKAMGADLEGKRLAVLAVEAYRKAEGGLETPSDAEAPRLNAWVLSELRRAAAASGSVALAAPDSDRVLCVLAIPTTSGVRRMIKQIGEEILGRIEDEGDLTVVIGVSPEVGPESLRDGRDEAIEAAEYGIRIGDRGGVYHFDDLGLQQLLLRLADGPELAYFVESQLAPLLAHDARGGVPLVSTLKVYLDCGGSKSAAARALHMERRSLYHRLELIEKALGRDVDEPETRTKLTLALRALEVLHGKRFPALQV